MPEDYRREDLPQGSAASAREAALAWLERHLSPEAEAERRSQFHENMAELRAAREELNRIIGVGAKE